MGTNCRIKKGKAGIFKTRYELMREDIIYPDGEFIQVKGENERYVANGRDHFKDLQKWIDFPDDKEMAYSAYKGWVIIDRK